MRLRCPLRVTNGPRLLHAASPALRQLPLPRAAKLGCLEKRGFGLAGELQGVTGRDHP